MQKTYNPRASRRVSGKTSLPAGVTSVARAVFATKKTHKKKTKGPHHSLHCQVDRPLENNRSFWRTNVRRGSCKLRPILAVDTARIEHDEKRKSAPFQNERSREANLLQRVERGSNHFCHRPCKRHEPKGRHFGGLCRRHGQDQPDLYHAGEHLLENYDWVRGNNF